MNNNVYLIHEEDYIKHIDDKVELFMMLQGLANLVSKLPPDEKNIPAIALAKHHRNESEAMFKTWGIPRSYMIFGSESDLAELMENELIAPEDAGYFACEGERYCGMCDCYCNEDVELEVPSNEEFAARVLEELTNIVRSVFGKNASFHIYVD